MLSDGQETTIPKVLLQKLLIEKKLYFPEYDGELLAAAVCI
jgi:hypothetical protein